MTISDEGLRTIRLTVTLTPGTSAALVVELMNAIRGRPGVADVVWTLPATEGHEAHQREARARVLSDQIMWLLGHLAAPVDTSPNDSGRVVRLTVTVARGASYPRGMELLRAIRGQPEVAAVSCAVFPPAGGEMTWALPTDVTWDAARELEFSDQMMCLLGHLAPV
jgi:hypothetical protein